MTTLRFGDFPADMNDPDAFGFGDRLSDPSPEILRIGRTAVAFRDRRSGANLTLKGVFDYASEAAFWSSPVTGATLSTASGQLLFSWQGWPTLTVESAMTLGSRTLDDYLLAGNDSISGGGGSDILRGGDADDSVSGGLGADTIRGELGNDWLDGGSGADSLAGGPGDDTFVVDHVGDRVSDSGDPVALVGGIDRVRSSVGFTLGTYLEHLTLTGSATIDGAGNSRGNTIVGNNGANRLSGEADNDRLDGMGGNDTLDGGSELDTLAGGRGNDLYIVGPDAADQVVELAGEGKDTVRSGTSFSLADQIERLELIGSAAIYGSGNDLDNTLIGNGAANRLRGQGGEDRLEGQGGADELEGGAGADTLIGGPGNDLYVDPTDPGDRVLEQSGGGTDSVSARTSYTLPANVENLTLFGGQGQCVGNALNNWLVGGDDLRGLAGNDLLDGQTGDCRLDGGSGNDTLVGGPGPDTLIGGEGADRFKFWIPQSGPDRILDFEGGSGDRLAFIGPNFGNLPVGRLAATRFRSSPNGQPADADDRFLFDTGRSVLAYDPDGTGPGAAVDIAILDAATLWASEIVILGA
jgi:Ca2+-binding RTX toxin-like protein